MKKFILAALSALPFLALGQQQATAGGCCGGSFKICFTFCCPVKVSCCCNCCTPCGGGGCGGCGGCGSTLGPWYSYWPYAAHFQTPAPTGYPYWSSPMTPQPAYGAAQYPAGPVQPASYYQQAPSYWYGQ